MNTQPASQMRRRTPRIVGIGCVGLSLLALGTTASAVAGSNARVATSNTGCPSGLLTNWSFEIGMLGWTKATGTMANASASRDYGINPWDGTEVMYLTPAKSAGEVYQEVAAYPGGAYRLTFAGGTHQPRFNHEGAMVFIDKAGNVLAERKAQIDYDVDAKRDLMSYDLGTHVAPAGTDRVRVSFRNADGDWTKADAACLTGPAGPTPTTTTTVPPTTAPPTTAPPTTTTTTVPARQMPNPPT